MNVCSWTPQLVTLVDGRSVPSDSEEWRLECECRHVLAKPYAERLEVLTNIGQRRGPDALASLQAAMDAVEPAYVLSLPNQAQRRGYLATISNYLGENAASHLKNRAMDLHNARKASNCAAPAS